MIVFKKLRISLALLLTLALFGIWTPAIFAESSEQVEEVRGLLEQYHISKPDEDVLKSDVIDEMVESLHDPYTKYFDDEEWKSFNSALEQTFVGIGIVMVEDNGKVYVEDVIAGSPAELAGIEPGDALVSSNGISLLGKTVAEVQDQVRGVEGSVLVLSLSRNGKILKFKVKRQTVQIPAVASRMLGDGVGYLALSGFTLAAGSLVKSHLAALEKKGLTSLVLDLRNNGGGYVNTAQEIAGLFIQEGVLANLRDRDGNDVPLKVTGTVKPYPVMILVNGGSASASELLSGAMQDYGVAKLVGTQTYGKGVVQSLLQVQSGGVLKVTIEEYFTPNGRKVDKVGLKPDVVLEGTAEQLITAYRLGGGQNVKVVTGNGTLTVNGVRLSQPGVTFKEKNVWYVNLKLAAVLTGSKLNYNASKREITLTKGTIVHTLKTNDTHLIIKDGKSNIDARLLAKWYSNFKFSSVGNMLKIAAG